MAAKRSFFDDLKKSVRKYNRVVKKYGVKKPQPSTSWVRTKGWERPKAPAARRRYDTKQKHTHKQYVRANPKPKKGLGSPSVPAARPKGTKARRQYRLAQDRVRKEFLRDMVHADRAGGGKRWVSRRAYNIAMGTSKARTKAYGKGTPYADDRIKPGTGAAVSPYLKVSRGLANKANSARLDEGLRKKSWGNKEALNVLSLPYQVGRATYEDPGGVASGTGKQLIESAKGLVGGTAKAAGGAVVAAAHPQRTSTAVSRIAQNPEQAGRVIQGAGESLARDYRRRLGPLARGETKAFRERLQREGALPEILDVSAAFAVQGKALQAGLKTVPAARFATRARPALRVSGNTARKQRLSGNAFVVPFQRGLDQARRRRSRRAVERPDRGASILDVLAQQGKNEVAPLRRKKSLGDRDVASDRSRNFTAFQADMERSLREARATIGRGQLRSSRRLSKKERSGIKVAMQYGIRDPERAREILSGRIEDIQAARKQKGYTPPAKNAKTNDELLTLATLMDDAEDVFTPKLAQAVRDLGQQVSRSAKERPGLPTEESVLRRYKPLAAALRMEPFKEGDNVTQFALAVRRKAQEKGLETPAYFKSESRPTKKFGNYAPGSGIPATKGDKQYTGAAHELGIESHDPQLIVDSMARDTKLKYNWRYAANIAEKHAVPGFINRPRKSLLHDLDQQGIDERSVVAVNFTKFHELEKEHTDLDAPEENVSATSGGTAQASKAFEASSAQVNSLRRYTDASRWTLVPKAQYDELAASLKSSGAAGRGWDIAKGTTSKYMLGTSPGYLPFQLGANALQSGLTGSGVVNAIRGTLFERGLAREVLDGPDGANAYLGVGASHSVLHRPKMGAAMDNRLANGYRAFKESPIGQAGSRANPLDRLLSLDPIQNDFWRRGLRYQQLRKRAYKEMGDDIGKVYAAQHRLLSSVGLKKSPAEAMERIMRDPEQLEEMQQYVNKWLGDYSNYTTAERKLLKRIPMFYGFMRFSIHFMFRTLPVDAPVRAALIQHLGQLHAEEVKEILGGDEMPYALGNIYWTEDGQLRAVELSRLNPAANVALDIADAKNPFRAAAGSVPPFAVAPFEAAFNEDMFTGRTFKINGETSYEADNRDRQEGIGGIKPFGRVMFNQMGDVLSPYRMAKQVKSQGRPFSDDSLPWDMRYTQYSSKGQGKARKRDIAKDVKLWKSRSTGEHIADIALPFIPHDSDDAEIARNIREYLLKDNPKETRKPVRKRSARERAYFK